jgi:hypothetical protein
MGRTVICLKCQSTFNESVLENRENPDICPVCGASLSSDGEDEHSDWITWYYYGFKNSSSGTMRDKPIDLNTFGDTYYLIKEFKAPPKDKDGNCDAAKAELRRYVPDAFAETKKPNPAICCPRCGSTEYTLMNRGYSVFTGFLGSGKVKRVCNRCKREF